MSKRFVTIFYLATNQHLTKDVGMIPYLMYKHYGYDSYLVTYKCNRETYIRHNRSNELNILDDSYSYVNSIVKGLRLNFISDRGRLFGLEKSVVFYLIKNSRKIDILNLYHYSFESLIYGFFYKLLNFKGILYIKMDCRIIGSNGSGGNKSFLKKFIGYFIRLWYVNQADLISLEIKSGLDSFNRSFPKRQKKFFYLPNGFSEDQFLSSGIETNDFSKKENIILYVGRVGSPEKNNNLLLDAIEQLDLKDWKVVLIGKIESKFHDEISDFFKRNFKLIGKVIFIDGITEKKELYKWYNRSKVFCLTSNYEGFPLVIAEALYFGNFIVSTRVGAVVDIVDNERIGSLIEIGNHGQLKDSLKKIIDGEIDISFYFKEIMRKSKESYIWESIIEKLKNKIEENN